MKDAIKRVRDRAASGLADRVADRLEERLSDALADRLVERLAGPVSERLAGPLADSLEGRLAERLEPRLSEGIAGAVAGRVEESIFAAVASFAGARPGGWSLSLDYAPSANLSPRWSKDGPRNAALVGLVEASRPLWSATLDRVVEVAPSFAGIAESLPEEDPAPRWRNPMLAGLDALALGALLARGPATYLEIGSGNSTKFVRRFLSSRGLATRVLSIDPAPRAECDALCDEIQRTPFELADLSAFGRLVPGDVVFLDGSHRCFTNSDVTVFFLEVLPRLPAGVIVGVHDVFLPDDYPREWTDRHYSEQYVLAAWLLGAGARAKILFPAYHVCVDAGDDPRLAAARSASGCPADAFHGCAFWFEVPG